MRIREGLNAVVSVGYSSKLLVKYFKSRYDTLITFIRSHFCDEIQTYLQKHKLQKIVS